MHDVFISFSFEDQKTAEEIVNVLTSKYGISCWICTRDIDGGKRYKKLIPQAIDDSSAVVFIQSEKALASKEIPKEIGMAFDADKTIIPFKLDDAKPQGDLRYDLYGVEYIDATIPTLEERIDELAGAILKILGRTSASLNSESTVYTAETLLKSGKIICHEIFAGRNRTINDIHTAFCDRNVVFLHGMGGIGKSELACQYWKANRNFYSAVVFARYDSSLAALIADDKIFNVNGSARKTKEDNTLQTDEEYAKDKINIIKKNTDEHTLIIIDNYDVISDPFFDEFVCNADFRVLVTTRCEPERGKYFVIPVKEIEDCALKKIFIEYANPEKTFIDEDDKAFPELFELTSRHTLTLELIAKYMDEKAIDDIGEIVDLLKKRNLQALSDSDKKDGFEAIKNIFHMNALSDTEKAFMRCLALMPPSGVSQKLFKKWCGDIFSARSRLVDLSLVKINSENRTISLHPIIRDVVINELKPSYENCRAFLDKFTIEIDERNSWNLPLNEKQAISNCSDGIIESKLELSDDTFNLFYKIGILKNFIQEYEAVMPLHERLYRYSCEHYGSNSFQTGCVAFKAGWVCKKYLLLDEATLWLEKRAYPVLKQHAEKAYSEYPHCCTNLATLYIKKYELSDVLENLRTADAYIKEADRVTVTNYNNLIEKCDKTNAAIMYQRIAGVRMEQAEIYMKQCNYESARRVLEEANKIITSYSENSADLAYLTSKFAAVYYSEKKYDTAISLFNKTLELYTNVFLSSKDYTLNIYIMLADCYEKKSDREKALYEWEKAYEIAKDSLTEQHPTLIKIKEHISKFA